jgi:alkylation response protein AidB-like acyl-CoA dehydrogenase
VRPVCGVRREELARLAGVSVDYVRRLEQGQGASGFQRTNPFQRFWRDVEVGTRYAGLNPYITAEDHGRLLVDLEPPVSMAL